MCFHGTDNVSALNIIKKKEFTLSRGDDHWLGDGIYFYEQEEYAFRWILIKYTNNFQNDYSKDFSRIFEKYTLLKATISENCRYFDLDDIKNRILFMETTKELKEQVKLKSRFDASQIVDGVVINILFESYGLSDRYDAVKAIFPISYVGRGFSRMAFLPEKQICIRNTSVIEQIKKHNDLVVPSGYEEFISSYNILKKELIGRKEYKCKQYLKRRDSKREYNYK